MKKSVVSSLKNSMFQHHLVEGFNFLEIITEKDKEKLQNIMAFGKDSPQHEKSKRPIAVEDEPEIDRFEEGKSVMNSLVSLNYFSINLVVRELCYKFICKQLCKVTTEKCITELLKVIKLVSYLSVT